MKRLLVGISSAMVLATAAVGGAAPAIAQPPCEEQQAQLVAAIPIVATDDEAVANEEAAFTSATELRNEASASVAGDRARIAADTAALKVAEEENDKLAILVDEKTLKADELQLTKDQASVKEDAQARSAQAAKVRAAKAQLRGDYKKFKAAESALNACLRA